MWWNKVSQCTAVLLLFNNNNLIVDKFVMYLFDPIENCYDGRILKEVDKLTLFLLQLERISDQRPLEWHWVNITNNILMFIQKAVQQLWQMEDSWKSRDTRKWEMFSCQRDCIWRIGHNIKSSWLLTSFSNSIFFDPVIICSIQICRIY